MSTQEIATANDFIASPTGRKWVKQGIVEIYSANGLKAPEAMPNFSDDEGKRIVRFSQSELGRKLTSQHLFETPPGSQIVKGKLMELLKACGLGK